MGVVSGYFVIGTLWSFGSQAQYPLLAPYIQGVPPELSHITEQVLKLLPPVWLDQPTTIFICVVDCLHLCDCVLLVDVMYG